MYLKKGIKIMRNITINHKNRTIVITKAFNKMASIYGTDEYIDLRQAKLDNPGYKVVVKTTKAKKEAFKGLDYPYMEKYIAAHDDEDGTIMAEYEMLRGISEEAKELLVEPASYFEMKEWFFIKFPEVAAFHKKREDALEEIRKTVEARKAAAKETKKAA